MGVNQSRIGTDKNAAILNLHLATGQIGRPGAGPFSLTGQPNAMGGRETGGLAHLLPGYRRVTDPAARAEVERHWGVAPGRSPPRPGRAGARDLRGRCAAGDVRAVWIVCTNPAASMPDPDLVERALRQAELVIVQDAYHPTETTRFADVLLPAAQWPEKDGVMTNSERRLTLPAAARRAAGRGAARRGDLRARRRASGLQARVRRTRARARVFDEFAALTRGRAVRLARASATRACAPRGRSSGRARAGRTPAPRGSTPTARFPTPDGRARFVAGRARRAGRSRPTRAFPLTLTTGRVRDHWHTLTRTGKAPALCARTPEPLVEINARDARARRRPGRRLRGGDLAARARRSPSAA